MATKTALQIAQEQKKSGLLSDVNAQKLVDLGKAEIAKAGGDYNLGIKNAKAKLAGFTAEVKPTLNTSNQTSGAPVTQPVTPVQNITQAPNFNNAPTPTIPVADKAPTPAVGLKTAEPIKTQQPKDINPAIQAPTSIQEWKNQGSNIADLEQMIESGYNTVATNENGVLKANIGGVDYQWVIDEAGNPIKTKIGGENADSIYNQLLTGQEIPDTGIKQTPQYAKAQARYNTSQKYSAMSTDQLYNAYVNGEIGTSLERDIAMNPNLAEAKAKYEKKVAIDDINNTASNVLSVYNKKDTSIKTQEPTYLEKLSQQIIDSFNAQGKDVMSFKSFMDNNYPELTSDTVELNQKNTDIQKLVDERDARLENIIKENPGISINRATMLAARQNKDTNAQIKSMSYEIGNLQANINYQTQMASKDYDFQLTQQDRADKLEQEKRGFAFDMLQQEQSQQQQAQRDAQQFEQQKALIDLQQSYKSESIPTDIITDPATGKQALINTQTGEIISTFDTGLKPGTESTPDIKNIGTADEPNYVQYNSSTNQWDPISVSGAIRDEQGNIDYSSVDFTSNDALINQYPNEASFKNNNPTGMTWGISNNLKGLFDKEGVSYEQGTYRPKNEGGNYIKFASVQDGLDAYRIALTQAGSDSVYNRLATWVGTMDTANNDRYAKDLMAQAGIDRQAKFSDLSEDQLGLLMSAQLQRESPNFYNELAKIEQTQGTQEPTFDKNKLSEYTKYVENGTVPTGLKQGSKKYNDFVQSAQEGYIDSKNESFKSKGFTISNPDAFIGTSTKQKEAIAEAVNNVAPFIQSMDKVIAQVDKYGTETKLSDVGKKMNQEIRNAQLIAKEIYNLGVLNGPDLELMESIIANPTTIGANMQLWSDYGDLLRNGKKTIVDNALAKAKSVGLEYTGDVSQPIYTDKDGVDYTKESLIQEIERAIDSKELTEEGALQWLEENNLSSILD